MYTVYVDMIYRTILEDKNPAYVSLVTMCYDFHCCYHFNVHVHTYKAGYSTLYSVNESSYLFQYFHGKELILVSTCRLSHQKHLHTKHHQYPSSMIIHFTYR